MSSWLNCSREKSRAVASYLKKNVYRMQSNFSEELTLPSSCPIHPLANIFYYQEKNYSRVFHHEVECLYCKKRFKNVFYMDRHMNLRHKDKLHIHSNSLCFETLCNIFGCLHRDEKIHKKGFNNLQFCGEKDLFAAKMKCNDIFNRYSGFEIEFFF